MLLIEYPCREEVWLRFGEVFLRVFFCARTAMHARHSSHTDESQPPKYVHVIAGDDAMLVRPAPGPVCIAGGGPAVGLKARAQRIDIPCTSSFGPSSQLTLPLNCS